MPFEDDARRLSFLIYGFAGITGKLNCPQLEKDKVSFRYDTNSAITIMAIYKIAFREIAQSLLFGEDIAETWDDPKPQNRERIPIPVGFPDISPPQFEQ